MLAEGSETIGPKTPAINLAGARAQAAPFGL